jgi:hypothetical protein
VDGLCVIGEKKRERERRRTRDKRRKENILDCGLQSWKNVIGVEIFSVQCFGAFQVPLAISPESVRFLVDFKCFSTS